MNRCRRACRSYFRESYSRESKVAVTVRADREVHRSNERKREGNRRTMSKASKSCGLSSIKATVTRMFGSTFGR
ncbi:hypothetical protein MUK42_10489 [Musa troglodytarum]|uniref:Uncharacterized protein n=1 Tax=Musa troglodytarum TaxID=320322 RepID=A0A9E7ETE2_9LILI|nr:hypothetical protein MUK42_10489 [Musa troglodytarum]